jgi:hypothetical protein
MLFENIRNQVIGVLLPDYQKTIHGVNSLAQCETPTQDFISKLAKIFLPEKAVTIGEALEQTVVKDSYEPHVVSASKENTTFVQEITEQAEKFVGVFQVEEASID